jgi:GNAT superfamily N-acetyltransferase
MRLRSATTDEVKAVWEDRWFGIVVGLDTVYTPEDVEGLALVDHLDEMVGLVTFHVDGPAGQIVTLDTIVRGRGFGRQLLEAVESTFHARGLGRAWALMTNDNLRAAGLYLSRGYRLVRVHLDAIDRVRAHKPNLPERGYEGIPIRDLWEFEKLGPLVGIPVP